MKIYKHISTVEINKINGLDLKFECQNLKYKLENKFSCLVTYKTCGIGTLLVGISGE
jgi:hypothetical protein